MTVITMGAGPVFNYAQDWAREHARRMYADPPLPFRSSKYLIALIKIHMAGNGGTYVWSWFRIW